MLRKLTGRKLKSQTGATLLIALLAFVVCAVVGSIALAGATGVSGRAATVRGTRQEADQRYYTLESAALLLENQIKGQTVYAVVKTDSAGENRYYSHESYSNSSNTDLTLLEQLVAKKLGDSNNSGVWESSDEIDLEISVENNAISDVDCKLTVGSTTYNLTANLTISDSSDSSDSIIIYFPSTVTEVPEITDSESNTTTSIKVSWNSASRQ